MTFQKGHIRYGGIKKGYKQSEEHRRNIGLSRVGKKYPKLSEIKKLQNKGESNPMFGKNHTEETKSKVSIMFKGRHHSPQTQFKKGQNKLDKNHMWKGGISFEPYSLEWTNELRTKIRKKYGFQCQLCFKNGFDVHHIDYNKKNCSEDNLTVLCRRCHPQTNHDREYWINRFKGVPLCA